ncbi:MAG: hypothetical protein WDZ64_00195 [Parcubacteria group bacterium]
MLFDIYPLVVHYPVAFLTFYSMLELIRFRSLTEKPYWFYIKAITVVVGEISAIVAVISARASYHYVEGIRLVDMHEIFGYITAIIFGIIALTYLMEWFGPTKFSSFIMRSWVIIPFSLIGLFFIVVTGGLFGAMVYGTQFDPFLKYVFIWLGVY